MLNRSEGPQTTADRLPDFVCVGAAKSGSTSLYHYLAAHPQVFMSRLKEPHFFATSTSRWDQGLDWYRTLFAEARPDQLCGEASTTYTWDPEGIPLRRMAEVIPNVRLIYLLRNPVDRAYSQYIQNHWEGRVTPDRSFAMSFEEYFEAEPEVYNASNYLPQIRMMRELFGPESLRIYLFDDLIKQPEAILRAVFDFLGVEDISAKITGEMIHANKSERNVGYMVRGGVLAPFRQNPAIRRIYDAIPRDLRERLVATYLNSPIGRRVGKRFTPQPMRPGTRRALIERFAPTFDELSQLVGADLSSWLDPREAEAPLELAGSASRG